MILSNNYYLIYKILINYKYIPKDWHPITYGQYLFQIKFA